jgi:hypothetical protein
VRIQLRPLRDLLEAVERREPFLAHRSSGRRFACLDIGADITRRDFPLSIGIDQHPTGRVRQIPRLLLTAPMEDIAAIEALRGFGIFLQHHVMDGEGAGEPRHAARLRAPQTDQPNEVGRVGVRRQLLLIAVRPRQWIVAAEVFDVAEPVAEGR